MLDIKDCYIRALKEVVGDLNLVDVSMDSVKADFTGDNFFGVIHRIKVKGKNNERYEEYSLFCKTCQDIEIMRKYLSINFHYRVETFCYESILPVLKGIEDIFDTPDEERFLYPKFFKSVLDQGEEIVILEDLSEYGYNICDRRESLDFIHMKEIIENLANFHALSFVLKEINPQLFDNLASKIGQEYNYGDKFMDIQLQTVIIVSECIENDQNRKIIRERLLNNSLYSKYKRYFSATDAHPYNAICHGDLWINNILFKLYNGKVSRPVFIDWQFCRLASPVTDIAYLISLSTDKEFRSYHLKEILKIYYDTLARRIISMGQDIDKCYPKKVFDKHIKEYFQFGLVISMVALNAFLSNPGGEKSLEDIFRDFESDKLSVNFNSAAVTRINDLVDEFIAEDLI